MGDRFENTAIIETPDLDDYIRLVTKEGGTRRALASELAKKIVEEYEGSSLGGEERTIQAAISDAKQVASEAIQEEQTARQNADTTITADLAKKAYADGEYADLHAGTANQLLADTYTSDEEPYHYRATPSNAGTREMDEIVGGSVVWNQLVNTSTSSVTVTSGHKYVAKISDAWSVGASTGTALNVTGGTDMVFDITQMFPSTIADHIYNLEQANEGAGTAFFKKYFGDDYHPYDAGTMRSVEGLVSHDMVGFNQWDEEWEVGDIANGVPRIKSNSIRSKNFTKCIPNTMYFVYCGSKTAVTQYTIRIVFYDRDKNFLGNSAWCANLTFSTPLNCEYFKITTQNTGNPTSTYGEVYNHDICINLSDSAKNGTYEPYTKHTYPLDNSVTLRGIPQLVDGQLKWDGDIYPPSGLISRKYNIVDMGTLDWVSETDTKEGLFRANASSFGNALPKYLGNLQCGLYSAGKKSSYSTLLNGEICVTNSQTMPLLRVCDTTYTDATAFKTAMSGVYLIYELATPTTEQAEPYQSLQTCSPYGTEEYVTTGIVPVGHYTKYPTDLKSIVEQIADAPSADGTYTLKATVSGGKVTYSWESANG